MYVYVFVHCVLPPLCCVVATFPSPPTSRTTCTASGAPPARVGQAAPSILSRSASSVCGGNAKQQEREGERKRAHEKTLVGVELRVWWYFVCRLALPCCSRNLVPLEYGTPAVAARTAAGARWRVLPIGF
jgi:hypothetical protein